MLATYLYANTVPSLEGNFFEGVTTTYGNLMVNQSDDEISTSA